MSAPDVERLRSIKTFPSLIKYLRDELDWPIDSDHFDDLTFDYEPEELGLDAKAAVRVKEIKQLRPLTSNQPWGIFFLNFEPKRLPVVILRRILRSLIIKKRQSATRAQQATWQLHDLLFISSYGESDHRDITFAHFSEDEETGDLPTLRVLGWDDEDTILHLEHTHQVLNEKLRWPENQKDLDAWRTNWSSAFTLRHREVISTSRTMAVRLAELATRIRKRVNRILAVESDKGPLKTLMAAFQEALIHDLSEDDFADMYAQTITYGLLTARVSRPSGLVAENIADMVPVTNPFLRDILSTFLTVGGRKGKIDFDEVGITDVVQALRNANMEAVLRDFGDVNPQEDPVVHFYELFLKEYDPKKRVQRGVFYTPRPVVSYIVRSIHELLQTELGLEDGLASTTTWGEMTKAHANLSIPEGVKATDPFVQVLDPACGTGTFLVEVIDVIHNFLIAKWGKQGHAQGDPTKLWNEYVPASLLPRLYGFELMMAPYAVAPTAAGDSLEQQEAEDLTIGLLAEKLGAPLSKKRFELPAGGWLEIDGYCESPRILCEAWAHQGKPKPAQKNKVMADALKLLYAASLLPGTQRIILGFADEEAASHFRGSSWMAQALKARGIETVVVALPVEVRERILAAQKRQFR